MARSKATVLVDGADDGGAEHQELHVLVRRVARLEQVALRAVAERPVKVLAGTVDAREWLLVQEALEAVFARDLLQRDHDRLLVIGSDVGVFVNRRDFVLRRRDPRCGGS